MNANTAKEEFSGSRDRRKHVRRAVDRVAVAARGKACCAEAGCEERVWPGSRFCVWHPKLGLARQRPGDAPCRNGQREYARAG